MAKRLRTKRLHFSRVKQSRPIAPLPPSSAHYGSNIQRQEVWDRFSHSLTLYKQKQRSYKRERGVVFVHNTSVALSLLFRVVCVALAIGFLFVLWSRDFNFHSFMTELMSSSVAPFDFTDVVSNVNSWVEGLPSWLDWAGVGVRAVAMLFIGAGYLVGFVFNLLGVIFG